MASLVNSTKHLRRINTNPSQILPKKSKSTLPNSFYKASITLIPEPYKFSKGKKLQANNPDEQRCTNSQENLKKLNSTIQ